MAYTQPRVLHQTEDQLAQFECTSSEQTTWLRRHAVQASQTGTAKVFVVTDHGEVVAYYAWSMASILLRDAPKRLTKGAGRYPQPIALLARLAVSQDHVGQGLGAGMLRDVILRTSQIGKEIGCRGLLVHCESEAARDFYTHLVPEFEQSPTNQLHLVLLLKDIQATIRAG